MSSPLDINIGSLEAWEGKGGSGLGRSNRLSTFVPPVSIRPLGDRVLVKVIQPDDVVKNGLYIPEQAQEKPQEGIVVAVGRGRVYHGERVPVDVEVGQKILFGKYSGNDVSRNGEKYLLLQEDEIQAQLVD